MTCYQTTLVLLKLNMTTEIHLIMIRAWSMNWDNQKPLTQTKSDSSLSWPPWFFSLVYAATISPLNWCKLENVFISTDHRKALTKRKSETSSGWWSECYFLQATNFGFLFAVWCGVSRSRNQFILILFKYQNERKLSEGYLSTFRSEIGEERREIDGDKNH